MQNSQRFYPLDLFRGLTIAAMILVNTPGSWESFPQFLQHADWHGCKLADLIFPFFLFVAGASIPYSSRYTKQPVGNQWWILMRRIAILFMIGLFLNAFPFYHKDWTEYRLMGILQRIAIAYGLAYALILLAKLKFQGLIVGGVLILYHIGFIFYNPDDPFSLEGNIARSIDLAIIGPDHMWHGKGVAFDPEGLWGSLSAACTVWIGYFVSRFIKSAEDPEDSVPLLSMIGLISVGLGLVWANLFPVNKYLWTSSFVMYTSGLASMILVAIMLIPRRFIGPVMNIFVSAGKNPLLLFVLSILWVKFLIHFIGFQVSQGDSINGYNWIFNKVFEPSFGMQMGSFLFALTNALLFLIIGWFLDKRKVFVRI